MNGEKLMDGVLREMELETIDGFSLSKRRGCSLQRMEVWKGTEHAAYDLYPEYSRYADLSVIFDHLVGMIKEVSK